MTGAHPARAAADAIRDDGGAAAASVVARVLSLAATPTFAVMGVLTGVLGRAPMDTLCPAGHGSALSGMVPMYLLMGVFHASPWLRPAKKNPPNRSK